MLRLTPLESRFFPGLFFFIFVYFAGVVSDRFFFPLVCSHSLLKKTRSSPLLTSLLFFFFLLLLLLLLVVPPPRRPHHDSFRFCHHHPHPSSLSSCNASHMYGEKLGAIMYECMLRNHRPKPRNERRKGRDEASGVSSRQHRQRERSLP